MTTPDPITIAREALTKLNTMAEGWVATVFGSVEQNAAWDKRDAARLSITAALDYAEKLNAENERLTNKVQSQHDHMAPKYDAAMAEVEKLKAERDELEKEIDRLNRCFRIVPPANDFLPWKKVPWTMSEEMQKHFKLSLVMGGSFVDAWSSALSVVPEEPDQSAAITRLTSQLDLYKAALEGISEVDDDGFTSDGHERCAERAAMALSQAASQWIKDRQAKGEEE